jgi:hypothetical protein
MSARSSNRASVAMTCTSAMAAPRQVWSQRRDDLHIGHGRSQASVGPHAVRVQGSGFGLHLIGADETPGIELLGLVEVLFHQAVRTRADEQLVSRVDLVPRIDERGTGVPNHGQRDRIAARGLQLHRLGQLQPSQPVPTRRGRCVGRLHLLEKLRLKLRSPVHRGEDKAQGRGNRVDASKVRRDRQQWNVPFAQ